MSTLLKKLHRGLIVSCQAPIDSPLHDPTIISAMAETAVRRGAIGVRIDTPSHIHTVRKKLPEVPIIGIWKRIFPGYQVYITPRFSDAQAVSLAGADIIAIDATLRTRPQGENVGNLVAKIHQELGKLVMADIDTLEAAEKALEAGVDLVGTTLYGYTKETDQCFPPGFDLLNSITEKLQIPVICEGGISSPEMAKHALDLGAYAVVVGTDITGIDYKVKAYQTALKFS